MDNSGAILLAGGQSSRMGRAKAELEFSGQTLLERVLTAVHPLVSQLIVMLSASQEVPRVSSELQQRIEIGRDSSPGQGPLQGIADAMAWVQPSIDQLFVLSCDLPFLTTDSLIRMRRLLTADVDGVCAEVNNQINPLLAIYHRRLLSQSPSFLAVGKRSCMVLIDQGRIVRLQPPLDNPHVYNDINTPTAYEWAKSLLKIST
ncbi:molybdenum cofactor guanylyltransferase [bacterium]|nr:molybdenum cofactor guanylyltransferase [bacterium]